MIAFECFDILKQSKGWFFLHTHSKFYWEWGKREHCRILIYVLRKEEKSIIISPRCVNKICFDTGMKIGLGCSIVATNQKGAGSKTRALNLNIKERKGIWNNFFAYYTICPTRKLLLQAIHHQLNRNLHGAWKFLCSSLHSPGFVFILIAYDFISFSNLSSPYPYPLPTRNTQISIWNNYSLLFIHSGWFSFYLNANIFSRRSGK